MANEFSHVVFASAQGVRLVIEMEPAGERRDRMISALGKCIIVARGKLPTQALAEFGKGFTPSEEPQGDSWYIVKP